MVFNIPDSNGATFRANVNNALNSLGYNGSFLANELVDNAITINHNLGQEYPGGVSVYTEGTKISDANLSVAPVNANNLILTVNPSVLVPTVQPLDLWHFDNIANPSTFIESVNNLIPSSVNGVVQSSAQAEFGAGSLLLGPGNTLTYSSFNATGMTGISFWVHIPTGDYDSFSLISLPNCNITVIGGTIRVDKYGDGYAWFETGTYSSGSWHHIEINNILNGYGSIFLDGINNQSVGEHYYYYTLNFSSGTLTFSGDNPYLPGSIYIDELAFLPSALCHNSNFTPPTAPYSSTSQQFEIAVR